jgi:integrase/recombinase XerD
MKKSVDLRSWDAAQKLVRDWESGNAVERKSVEKACDAFIKDCEARKLAPETLGKYRLLTKGLKEWFGGALLNAVRAEDLREWREQWRLAPITSRKKLEHLRTFFRFCQESGWIATNPAKLLKAPSAKQVPTLPFSKDEMEKILWAVELFPNRGIHGMNTQRRVRAFVNVLRHSGLRIRDVCTLKRDKIQDDKMLLYLQKTGVPVFVPLPKSVIEDLEKADDGSAYYFWTGSGKVKSVVSIWQRTLTKLFEKAGIENGHAHRFRDTFSVNLLQTGVPLETVSILLGHSSIRITEKHYAPWVKSRQDELEAAVKKSWR